MKFENASADQASFEYITSQLTPNAVIFWLLAFEGDGREITYEDPSGRVFTESLGDFMEWADSVDIKVDKSASNPWDLGQLYAKYSGEYEPYEENFRWSGRAPWILFTYEN